MPVRFLKEKLDLEKKEVPGIYLGMFKLRLDLTDLEHASLCAEMSLQSGHFY